MRRLVLGLPALLLLATASARADEPSPAAVVAAAHAKHADLTAKGLTSFRAWISVRRSDDENVSKVKESLRLFYAFTAPDKEEFDFDQTPETARKPLQDALSGVWREMTGALWFGAFEGAEDLAFEAGGPPRTLGGTSKANGAFHATFDEASGRLASARIAPDTVTRTWTCVESDQGLRVKRRDLSLQGNRAVSIDFDVWRSVRGFALPTVLKFDALGKKTEFLVEYQRIDDAPALAEEWDPALVKARVEEAEKGWKGWTDAQKVERLLDLAEIQHDLASAAIARLGLKDASLEVRERAAEALGVMKRANVVPALLAAMPANEKEIRVYLRVIAALGEIGDPRAVDALSKDWWNQRVPEYAVVAAKAKIRALGRIRHATAVDALLDTFTLASDDKISLFRGDIVESLTKLARQTFLFDRKAWNDWWKKNRSTFRF